MKLSNMILVFALIIIPILLVFSMYVGYQVDTISNQSMYDVKLVSATRDSIAALEMNTFGDSTKDNVTSTRRNIQASINTFVNSLAANFGVSGYDKSDILTYVPALLYTMYDGYYIYGPTTDKQDLENGASYVLRPYMYYSARYQNNVGSKKYDVVINYSLDNYITIAGTVDGEYISKSGYLIDTSKLVLEGDTVKTVKGIYIDDKNKVSVTLEPETLYETISLPREDYNLDGEISYSTSSGQQNVGDGIFNPGVTDVVQGKEPNVINLKCRYCYADNQKYYYYENVGLNNISSNTLNNDELKEMGRNYDGKWFTYNTTGRFIAVNDESLGLSTDMLEEDSAINYYQEAYEFTTDIQELFGENGIKANSMLKPDDTPVKNIETPKDLYYIFSDDTTNILDTTKAEESKFNQHKLNVMQQSITYNLNVAISNYSGESGIRFYMPEMSETEWDKILTNISMVSFVQGMPLGFKTYNNYAVVTSTNNQMYVTEESIYYVKNNADTTDDYHHTDNCTSEELRELEDSDFLTGYATTEFDKYVINYVTEFVSKKGSESFNHYISYYRHYSLDCYDCIINKNEFAEGLSDEDKNKILKAKIHAAARIKYNQYKATQYVNDKVFSE